jgi:hypothetical protein
MHLDGTLTIGYPDLSKLQGRESKARSTSCSLYLLLFLT